MRIPEDLRIVIHPLSLAAPEGARGAKRGEVVHLALSLLEGVPSREELQRAVLRAMALLGEGPSSWDLQADYVAPLHRLLSSPQARRWFEAEAYPELEVMAPGGGLERVDRLVVTEEGVEVVEFKVGRREAWHRGQVMGYLRLLGEVFEGRPLRGWLVYVDEGAILEVRLWGEGR